MTSYLLGVSKRATFYTILVCMAPVWWNCEQCKRILKDVGVRSVRQTHKKGMARRAADREIC
jgi:hypothetical protein